MESTPKFLQGVFEFLGEGFARPMLLGEAAYTVPFDKRSQLIYFRAGNSTDDLVNLILKRDGKIMRYFPIGAKEAMHVPLAVTEDLMPETKLEIFVAAPDGTSGTVVLDIGFVEVA